MPCDREPRYYLMPSPWQDWAIGICFGGLEHFQEAPKQASSRLRENYIGPGTSIASTSQIREKRPAGCSKRPSSKAAASEEAGGEGVGFGKLSLLAKRERRWRTFSASC
jgi:hypothetical protein